MMRMDIKMAFVNELLFFSFLFLSLAKMSEFLFSTKCYMQKAANKISISTVCSEYRGPKAKHITKICVTSS